MKLYMHPVSMTSRPVRLFMAEKGIKAEEEVVDLMTGAHFQEPYASIIALASHSPPPTSRMKPIASTMLAVRRSASVSSAC